MANLKKQRLKMLKQVLDDAAWMSACSLAEEIFKQYENLQASVDEIILNLNRKWVDSIGDDVASRLNRPLMCKSATQPGLLECNIDR